MQTAATQLHRHRKSVKFVKISGSFRYIELTLFTLHQRQSAKIQKKQQVQMTCCNFLSLELIVPRGTVKRKTNSDW